MSEPTLDFYYFETCPYCQKVLNVILELNIFVNYKDIYEDTNNMQKLMYITGRKTVPCLFIDGIPMHESRDIMEWLRENESKLKKIAE